MTEWDSSLDDSFAKLLGRQPSDAERQELLLILYANVRIK